jgi:hypothetical protein
MVNNHIRDVESSYHNDEMDQENIFPPGYNVDIMIEEHEQRVPAVD